MRIQDLENRTGLERATIRYYEREDLIRPVRTDNGYQDYSSEDEEQLLKIKFLRQLDVRSNESCSKLHSTNPIVCNRFRRTKFTRLRNLVL